MTSWLRNERGTKRRQQCKPDERSRRTEQRLAGALVQLSVEKRFEEATIQELLDRAPWRRVRSL